MKVELSSPALRDLEEILQYIKNKNPTAAGRVRSFIFIALQRISRHPEAAQKVANRPNIRRLPLVQYPYIVYYEVSVESITIVRILHTARRPWTG